MFEGKPRYDMCIYMLIIAIYIESLRCGGSLLPYTQLADNSKDKYESKILARGLKVNPYAIKTGQSRPSFHRQSTGAM